MTQIVETNRTEQTAEPVPRPTPGPSPYWLIAKSENSRIEVLILDRHGEEMLPVFSHEEEAEMFLRLLRGVGEDWRVRESRTGELVSVLYGLSCAGVKEVALDPFAGDGGREDCRAGFAPSGALYTGHRGQKKESPRALRAGLWRLAVRGRTKPEEQAALRQHRRGFSGRSGGCGY